MASDVTMPRLSDSMEEGTVLKWLVGEGGEGKRGEPLIEIENDKANINYDAEADEGAEPEGTAAEPEAEEAPAAEREGAEQQAPAAEREGDAEAEEPTPEREEAPAAAEREEAPAAAGEEAAP